MDDERLTDKLTPGPQEDDEAATENPAGDSPPDVSRQGGEDDRAQEPRTDLDPRDPDSAGNEDLRTPGED